jgi:hypothetical protein
MLGHGSPLMGVSFDGRESRVAEGMLVAYFLRNLMRLFSLSSYSYRNYFAATTANALREFAQTASACTVISWRR